MPYLNCSHCGLSVRILSAQMTMTNCPRCLVRARRTSVLELADEPARVQANRGHPGVPGAPGTPEAGELGG